MKRIFIPHLEEKIKLDKENLNYIKNVLRYKSGEQILAFDGEKEALCVFHGEHVETIKIVRKNESRHILQLAIAEIKPHRFEWLIEKATEIGVSEIFLLKTKFTQNKIHNIKRTEKIALQACMQCNRITIPKIHPAVTLDEFIDKQKIQKEKWLFGAINFPEKENNQSSKTIAEKKGIIIGPEGGFCEKEEKKLYQNFEPVKLSHNILRSETAALIGLIYIAQSLLFEKSHIQ